jgi:hypothetical protein
VKSGVTEPWRRRNTVENEFGEKMMLPEIGFVTSLIEDPFLSIEDMNDVHFSIADIVEVDVSNEQ